MQIFLQLQPVGTAFYTRDGDQCTPFYGRDGTSALHAVTHCSTVLLLQKSINRLLVLMLESYCNWLAAFYARDDDQCMPFYSCDGTSALLPVTHRHKGVVSMGLLQKSINDFLVLIPER